MATFPVLFAKSVDADPYAQGVPNCGGSSIAARTWARLPRYIVWILPQVLLPVWEPLALVLPSKTRNDHESEIHEMYEEKGKTP